jgi:hypothetical protein
MFQQVLCGGKGIILHFLQMATYVEKYLDDILKGNSCTGFNK